MEPNTLLTIQDARKKIEFRPYNNKGSKTMPTQKYPPTILIPAEDMIIGVVVRDGKNERYYTMTEFEQFPEHEKDEMNYQTSNLHIRFVPGEPSIFAGEQTLTHELAKKRKQQVQLNDGRLIVHTDEITKLKFLKSCNYNGSNKFRSSNASPLFEEWDITELSERANRVILDKADAAITIGKMNGPELEIFALALGENVSRFKAIINADTETLRRDILLKIEGKPEMVNLVLENQDMAIKAVVAKGLAKNIWQYDKKVQAVIWTSNQDIITRIPNGGHIINTLVSLIKKDQKWRNQFDDLKAEMGYDPLMKKADQQIKNAQGKSKVTEPAVEEKLREKFGPMVDLILHMIAKGAVKAKSPTNLPGSWFYLVDDGDNPRKWQGINKFIAALENERGLLKEINDKIKAIEEG